MSFVQRGGKRESVSFPRLVKKGFSYFVDLKTKNYNKSPKNKTDAGESVTRKLSMPKGVSCKLKPKTKVPHNHITN